MGTTLVLPKTGGAGSGSDTTLRGKHVISQRFAIIGSGTSGTVTKPTNSTILPDDLGGGTDAIVTTVSNSKPNVQSAKTSSGAVVATSFDLSGNWVLTGTPSTYPIAIVYHVIQLAIDYDGSDADIWGASVEEDLIPPSVQTALDLKSPLVDIQSFSASGTWTKPAGAKSVRVWGVGAGGGGGSGRKGAAATVRCGGGGGAAGLLGWTEFSASDLGSTETVTVGVGGAGGTAVTANSTNGNAGTAGGDSLFGAKAIFLGGNSGAGGTASTGTGGASKSAQNFANMWAQSPGAAASTTGLSGAQPANQGQMPNGGASGGGITSADVASAGSAGGNLSGSAPYAALVTGSANGGAGAASATANGSNGPSYNFMYGLTLGTGGGSSRANVTGSPGSGGNGGVGGGGGAGGGAALDTTSPQSGAGGAGGNGWLLVITYF